MEANANDIMSLINKQLDKNVALFASAEFG